MPNRSSKADADAEDVNLRAKSIVDQATQQSSPEPDGEQPADDGKNPAAVALGRLGGKKGGKARAEKLTAERRSEIAQKAAQARWAKKSD